MTEYKNYEDWYDNGPGSENMNRRIAQSSINYQQEEHQRQYEENKKKQEEIDSIIRRDKRRKAEIKRLRKENKELKVALKSMVDKLNSVKRHVSVYEWN